jgi:hypothetical protein
LERVVGVDCGRRGDLGDELDGRVHPYALTGLAGLAGARGAR